MPGTFQAVYNGTKAFIDSFAVALRNELKDDGVTVTVLMPGPVETEFFERADMMDTKVGSSDGKCDPADVAKTGFDALDEGRQRGRRGLEEQAAGDDGARDARHDARRDAPRHGGAGHREEVAQARGRSYLRPMSTILGAAIVPVTPFQQNATLFWCKATMKAVWVDPGGDLDALRQAARAKGVTVERIWLTHGHIDHAGEAGVFAAELGVPIEGPHRDDLFWLE